jgi:exodeoxyribonuclease V alpha subunit
MAEGTARILGLHPDRAQFPERVLEQLRELGQEDPAVLIAWELSGLAPGLDPDDRQRLFATCLALQATLGQGHTRMALEPAEGSAAELVFRAFGLEGFRPEPFLRAKAACLAGEADGRPLVLEGGWLYAQRFRGHEQELAACARALGGRAAQAAAPVDPAVLQQPVQLNGQQRAAVEMALAQPLTLVTGGPGTGKTSIVVAMLRALAAQPGLGLEAIALAAPTGKAAQRMGESIRKSLQALVGSGPAEAALRAALPEPSTLHRLLAWHPASERFRHGTGNPLPFQVVIVDEASMISQEHLCRLFQALAPGARLVLLGDAGQLPSVEPGRAFRDLVERLEGNRVVLTESYRMSPSDPDGRNILSVAGCIRAGQEQGLWDGAEPVRVRAGLEQLEWRQVELLEPGEGGMRAFLHHWFEREVTGLPGFAAKAGRVFAWDDGGWQAGDAEALGELFGHFDRFRILCALREAADLRGVAEINALMHGWLAGKTGEGLRLATPFVAGEPVLMTSNDYRRGIFNGDQGLVLKVAFAGQLRQAAVFPALGGFRAFPLEPLKGQLEHAFAMTVHKSQGSEYTRVAIVLPRNNHKALTRELLYTGLTRARTSVLLLAERERIGFAAGNPTVRESGLGERLLRSQ